MDALASNALSSRVKEFLSEQPLKMFIGGEWLLAASRGEFPVYDPSSGAAIAQVADAAVVGSAIVQHIADGVGESGASPDLARNVLDFVRQLASGVRNARADAPKEEAAGR